MPLTAFIMGVLMNIFIYDNDADFNTNPVLKFIPKKRVDGILRPAKPIYMPLTYPLPQAVIPTSDLGNLTPGDELIINGTRITIPGGGVDATMNAILCQAGNGYKVSKSAKNKEVAVTFVREQSHWPEPDEYKTPDNR